MPYFMIQAIKIIFILGIACLSYAQINRKLIFVQEVFRHGHRYPTFASKNDNSTYINTIHSSGQLTKQGKSMQYILGQKLYQHYWDKLFLNTSYYSVYNQSKFYVKSTNINRTIQSAQSQLAGIFENMKLMNISKDDIKYSIPQWPNSTRQEGDVFTNIPLFHPIPIHVEKGYMNPWDKGDFLRIYSSQICPNQNIWSKQNKNNTAIIKIVNDSSFVDALQKVRKVLKLNIKFWDLYKYYDNAVCMLYERRNVSEIWTTQNDTKKALDTMFVLDMYMKLFYQQKQLAPTATGYFNETFHHFQRVTKDASGVQWAFYSAHDTTIGNFLARMNLTNVDCIYQNYKQGKTKNSQSDTCILQYPWYTATLIFEVYRNQVKGRLPYYTFKVIYNGLQRRIPFCDWKTECPIEVYYNWFNSWKDDNYVQSCGIITPKIAKDTTYLTIAVLQFGIILCFVISAIYKHLNKKDKLERFIHKKDVQQNSVESKVNLEQSLISQES